VKEREREFSKRRWRKIHRKSMTHLKGKLQLDPKRSRKKISSTGLKKVYYF
jgi:hypothetical protein